MVGQIAKITSKYTSLYFSRSHFYGKILFLFGKKTIIDFFATIFKNSVCLQFLVRGCANFDINVPLIFLIFSDFHCFSLKVVLCILEPLAIILTQNEIVSKTFVASMTSTYMITSLASMTSTASLASKNQKLLAL